MYKRQELVTCKGQAPKRGKEMSDIGLIEDGGVLIHDDKIFAVGTTEELDKMINPDEYEIIDATGKTVLPGFVDSHTHFVSVSYTHLYVSLQRWLTRILRSLRSQS